MDRESDRQTTSSLLGLVLETKIYLKSTMGGCSDSIWAANSMAEGTDTEGNDSGDGEDVYWEERRGFLWLLLIWLSWAPGTAGKSPK